MALNVRDVYWFEVEYSNGEKATRPVVIIEINDGVPIVALFVALTHSKIKDFDNPYDKWKVPLFSVKADGLGDSSYAKANCIAEVDDTAFKSKLLGSSK
ncbi:hypothetical protein [Aneurinibacillus terranovensis]|uniref:hypothetical protein n=1 Tax=Aneurinibacillus terranovensis TaxID=278991 RepID=UPI00040E875C|nr:hypothetical protein [Aneurinibacillus terranovensis]